MQDPKPGDLPPLPIRHAIPVRSLDAEGETPFALVPDDETRARLARLLEVESLFNLAFSGVIRPEGRRGWRLEGRLAARVGQFCVVTLEPMETTLDLAVVRTFATGGAPDGVIAVTFGAGGEEEEGEEPPEPLGEAIDIAAIMVEELALAIEPYPRLPGAEHGTTRHTPPGAAPLDPAAEKPFAALAALREKLARDDE